MVYTWLVHLKRMFDRINVEKTSRKNATKMVGLLNVRIQLVVLIICIWRRISGHYGIRRINFMKIRMKIWQEMMNLVFTYIFGSVLVLSIHLSMHHNRTHIIPSQLNLCITSFIHIPMNNWPHLVRSEYLMMVLLDMMIITLLLRYSEKWIDRKSRRNISVFLRFNSPDRSISTSPLIDCFRINSSDRYLDWMVCWCRGVRIKISMQQRIFATACVHQNGSFG